MPEQFVLDEVLGNRGAVYLYVAYSKRLQEPRQLLDYRSLGTGGPRLRLFFPTKKAAEKHLAETSTKVSGGEYLDHSQVPFFKDAAEHWFKSKTDRRASHVADLRSRLDKHLLPRFGSQRLDRITLAMIENCDMSFAPKVTHHARSTGSFASSARSSAPLLGEANRKPG